MLNKLDVLNTDMYVDEQIFSSFLEDIYMSFYRKDRFRHISSSDQRIPKVKITDDIFNLKFYYKDKKNTENFMRLDGTVKLRKLHITSIILQKYEYHPQESNATLNMLSLFSKECEGHIVLLKNDSVVLIECGVQYSEKEIVSYMVETPESERKASFINAYKLYKEYSNFSDLESL